jgi:hypothetical protein
MEACPLISLGYHLSSLIVPLPSTGSSKAEASLSVEPPIYSLAFSQYTSWTVDTLWVNPPHSNHFPRMPLAVRACEVKLTHVWGQGSTTVYFL